LRFVKGTIFSNKSTYTCIYICKLTKERDCTWRIKTNDELDKLIEYKNIINHVKSQRLSGFGHLH